MSQADAWAAGASSSFTLLDFELQYSPAHEDEIIHVVGEDGALGCWNPINSVELVRAEGGEALWRPRAPVSVPSGAPVEYKYIVFRSGRLHRWEAFDGNRIVVPEGDHQAARRDVMDVLPPPRPASASAAALASMHIAGATAGAAPLPPVQDTSEQSAGDDDDVYAQAPTPAAMPRAASSTASELASTVGGAVLVVSYILPLSIQRAEGGGWAVEWNYDAVTAKKAESLTARKRVVWIGCPGIATEEDERESLAEKLQEFDSVPVFLEPEMQRTFYFGFCRAFLWPTLHNVIKDRRFSQKVWRAYCWVNKKFADKVIEVFEPSDHVWVHDYHLLLLPTSLLRKLHTPRVGLFLHTPFPSSEIFRTISVRDELLRGMLNCDLIGFHLFEYARHFLTCCKRMLGLEYTDFAQGGGQLGVRDGKRTVIVQVSHIGVEPDLLRSAEGMAPAVSLTPTVPRRASASDVHTMSDTAEDVKAEASLLAHLAEVRRQGKTLVVGVDEMERLKGIPLKLIAYEEFLRNNAEHNVVFVQVAVRAKNFTPAVEADYEDVKEEVSEVMSRLSKEYPGAVIFEELNVISMHGRGQLWRHADVAVFTPIREGVNAWPFEAIFARRDGTPGVTILSEFASCSRVLNGALRCNPWNTNQVRLTLERAVKMDEGERRARQERDLEFILHNTASSWAERFFDEMRKACARNAELQEEGTMIQLGFGLSGFRRVGLGAAFRPLDTTEVLAAYRKARRRAIFLDWGGTLVHLEAGFASTLIDYYRSSLPAQVAHVIKELAEDPRNMLMVLSGQDRKYVERAFGGIGDASFCAEHGFLYKLGSLPGIKRVAHTEWQQLIEDFDLSWKEVTLAILEAYTMRTNGSNVQQKGSSLVWNYSEVDREFGSMQAKELHHHLSTVLESYPVNIAMGKGYLEVRPRDINKGVMVDHIVSTLYTNCGGVDFVLCIGDDSADEYMFSALHARFSANALPHGAFAPALFTTVVGQKPSAAQYFLNDPDEVIELCQSLRLHSTRSNRNRSMNDLQSRGGMQDFGVSPSTSRHPRSNPFPALPGGTSFERARSSGIGGLGASGSGWQR